MTITAATGTTATGTTAAARAGPAQPRVSVIIPALNEARNLEHVFAALPAGLHEVILVDGRSADGTPAVARRLMPGIRVVSQTREGKGNALACGFAAATGDIIVMIDAGGSADPAEIPAFVAALTAGADFARRPPRPAHHLHRMAAPLTNHLTRQTAETDSAESLTGSHRPKTQHCRDLGALISINRAAGDARAGSGDARAGRPCLALPPARDTTESPP